VENDRVTLGEAFRRHGRLWQSNLFVYPVISRRSGGVSIGLNLNPDKSCNFDCVYCQVDRTAPAQTCRVDLARLEAELMTLLEAARDGTVFESAPFNLLPRFHPDAATAATEVARSRRPPGARSVLNRTGTPVGALQP
jgi:hypothetical protein